MHARLAEHGDRRNVLALWERSVRATHTFLTESDIESLRPAVEVELARDDVTWWLLHSEANGFATIGWSPTDGGGRPFPILRMRRKARAVEA